MTESFLPSQTYCTLPACSSTAAAALLRCWMNSEPQLTVVVTDSARSLEALYQDYHTLSGGDLSHCAYFPSWEELKDNDLRGVSPEIAGDRLQTLTKLHRTSDPLLVFTDIQSLMQSVPAPDSLADRTLTLRVGSTLEMEPFCEGLLELGYGFEPEVTDKGEAAKRGGVLDLWPPNQPFPFRLEFFGDEVDSIRSFDPATQRSFEKTTEIQILPAKESSSGESADFTDYLPVATRWFWFEYESIADHAVLYQESCDEPHLSWPELQHQVKLHASSGMLRTGFGLQGDPLPLQIEACAGLADIPRHGDVSALLEVERSKLIDQQCRLAQSGWSVIFCLNTDGSKARFLEAYSHQIEDLPGLHLVSGMITEGFSLPDLHVSVVGERDLYGLRKPIRNKYDPHASTRKGSAQMGSRLSGWTEIEPGEWVVHLEHGIGKYLGLYEIEVAGQSQEVLSIEYADNAKLHVPVAQAHLLSRYMGVGGTVPEPHRLGGSSWERQKITAEKAVKDLASQLLQTQAVREAHPGYAFAPDNAWQAEFEATFPFSETLDQETAIADTKQDMERPRPMDRLICGDVGYGKTEVAMRAAFKAVMDGKQVAMLVPTTILALQHYQSFQERMAAFPVKIEMLSRFRTASESREVVARLAQGQVDIIIGTHRIVSKDVRFKDLGLVIIDEEQRFGVRHKERLKEMKAMVDVLTLSATPIPRTLYLSLTGARDVSSIQTAPRERLPVKTDVNEFEPEIIRKSILRELNRGGQIFFLHNRVQTLDMTRRKLMEIVPEARISMAHGQMPERQLEDIIRRFSNGESDVLLCTTIIESGVDMPNVNTMIIDRADRFGLAELYQLRGRVGRYKHQAFCQLLLPSKGGSKAIARERIRVIRKYSALGSGFKIALRDLEIRGAGNLLGSQQSGHIASVGFELYCQLLEQSIRKLKNLPPERIVDVKVRMDFLDLRPDAPDSDKACCLPISYVEDEALRVEIYRRIAGLATKEKANELEQELTDRFGKLPYSVRNLLQVARIRIAASKIGVKELDVQKEKLLMKNATGGYLQRRHKMLRLYQRDVQERLQELQHILDHWNDE
ncbi:transcription-repair coupling factor [Kiritimatiellota bacterium B12222]|nr:transcription-repair coupling factor [Kiritimatiellota bacterium B12222]